MSFLAVLCLGLAALASGPIPYKVAPKLADVAEPVSPERVKLGGYLGHRVDLNESARLKEVDLEPLLAGFRKRPGSHPWIGEHIGKWMHAATLAWANSKDTALKKKLDFAAHELVKCQEPDGYLGTYTPDKRFGLFEGADWDVWSHKYCLIGLLTYYRFTGDKAALACCRRVGDLLIAKFGPGKKSILTAGTHMGMAATSVLEPIVLLYRQTGEKRYLDFAKHIVEAWDEPGGPKILASLTKGGHVGQTANGKAYEMTSNLVGLCELARATGDARYLVAAKNAWTDIVANQLYITGTASYFEHFHGDHDLPNAMSKNVGETCVTVTWIQLSEQLLRLTGEAKYADEIERSFYNHLAAAQRPDGAAWCYYTSLEGTKPYTDETCCCLSSGPRGMVLAPELACLVVHKDGKDYIAVNTFEPFAVNLVVRDKNVTVIQSSDFPHKGRARLHVSPPKSLKLGLMLREPNWAAPLKTSLSSTSQNGWRTVSPRTWKSGETVDLTFPISSVLVQGGPSQKGLAALTYGPFVLAWADSDNPTEGPSLRAGLTGPATPTGSDLKFAAQVEVGGKTQTATLVPFAEAGADGGRFRVWMRAPGTTDPFADSLFMGARESRSSKGNVDGSISDGDPDTFVVTFDGSRQASAWFSLSLPEPVEIGRVLYVHGRSFHDGGWFDASAGKPKLQFQSTPGGDWADLATLDSYPATTTTDAQGLRGGERFEVRLARPVRLVGLKILGKPASGDRPDQSFATCAELQATSK